MKFYVVESLKDMRPHGRAKVGDLSILELDETELAVHVDAGNIKVIGEHSDKLSAQQQLTEHSDTQRKSEHQTDKRAGRTRAVQSAE